MRAALFTLLLMTAGMTQSLAQTRVATLQHGDEISAFYGTSALYDAQEAAESGDVITLSSGTFDPCDIYKAITLRGAGCYEDTLAGVQPTIIGGSSTIYLGSENVEETTYSLIIEGIWFDCSTYHRHLNNPWFNKCVFNYFSCGSSTQIMQNASFVNCKFNNNYYNDCSINTYMINSILLCHLYNVTNQWSLTLNNSIVYYCMTSSNSALVAYNSILFQSGFGYGSSLYNCLILNPSTTSIGNPFMVNCLSYSLDEVDSVFVDFVGWGDDWNSWLNNSFILQPDFASSFLGTDGTQIGIYGGNVPFNKIPNYVRTQVNVASQSTEDGHLNVDVEIINGDE